MHRIIMFVTFQSLDFFALVAIFRMHLACFFRPKCLTCTGVIPVITRFRRKTANRPCEFLTLQLLH